MCLYTVQFKIIILEQLLGWYNKLTVKALTGIRNGLINYVMFQKYVSTRQSVTIPRFSVKSVSIPSYVVVIPL